MTERLLRYALGMIFVCDVRINVYYEQKSVHALPRPQTRQLREVW
jgi:hypothetical protein